MPSSSNSVPATMLTYRGQIQTVLQERCGSCHNANSSIPNWLDYNTAYNKRSLIYQHVVVDKSMPQPPYDKTMPDEDRKLIGDWVLAGAPEFDPNSSSGPNPTSATTPPTPTGSLPPSPTHILSYRDDILPIIAKRCSSCHQAGASIPNWSVYETAFADKDKIYQRIYVTRDMPQGNATGITDSERLEIAQWVLGGAPESGGSPGPNSNPTPVLAPPHSNSQLLTTCMSCHSPGAETVGPILVGQVDSYLYSQLKNIRSGERTVAFMNTLLKAIDDQTLKNLADYFSGLSPCSNLQATPMPLNGDVRRGKKISENTCMSCHETGALNAPKLEGQETSYISGELKKFKTGERPNFSDLMSVQAKLLNDQDIADVAAYYNSISTCGENSPSF